MSGEERLAQVSAELARLGVRHLVMGGHAARFYGVLRATVDFDLCVALDPPAFAALAERLRTSPLFGSAQEGPSWPSAIPIGGMR